MLFVFDINVIKETNKKSHRFILGLTLAKAYTKANKLIKYHIFWHNNDTKQ